MKMINKKLLFLFFFCPSKDFLAAENFIVKRKNTETPAEKNIFNSSLQANTFLSFGSNIALLNNHNNFDQSVFLQSIIDLGISMKTPQNSDKRKIEFNLLARMNNVLGSSETLQMVTPSKIKIGHSITEADHTHAFNKPLFFMKETWIKIYSESQLSHITCGLFPKQIGLGLILGNGYRVGNPLLTNNADVFIDQYRPGIQFETKFKDGKHSLSGYCGFEKMNSTSIDQQIELTRSQELQDTLNSRFIRKERAPLQNSFLVAFEGKATVLERTVLQKRSVTVSPFILYKYDPNQTVEFFGDAHSKLFTLGTSCDFTYKKFFGTVDFAVQGGQQHVKAWDRNVALVDGTKTLTHLFYEKSTGVYELSSFFPSQQDISLNYASGQIFSALEPDGTTTSNFQNSYSRFRKAYTNNLSGLLLAFDGGYLYNDKITFGAIAGVISGDENPNDTTEKVMLYRYVNTWNSVRKDKSNRYFGFQGTDSLYSGNNVHSHYLLRSNKLSNSTITTGPELIENSCSNLAYFGLSAKFEKMLESSNKYWNIQPNVICMLQTHKTDFGYDPTIVDIINTPLAVLPDKFSAATTALPRMLGVEFNTNFHFHDNENLAFYGSIAFFVPGDHYDKIKEVSYNKQGRVIPLKNQFVGEAANISGIETVEQNTITLLNNSSMNCYLGFSLNFDSITEFFSSKSTKHQRKKKIVVNKFIHD